MFKVNTPLTEPEFKPMWDDIEKLKGPSLNKTPDKGHVFDIMDRN